MHTLLHTITPSPNEHTLAKWEALCNMCSIGTAERNTHLVRVSAFATGPDEVKQKPKNYLFFARVGPVQLRKHRLQRLPLIELAVNRYLLDRTLNQKKETQMYCRRLHSILHIFWVGKKRCVRRENRRRHWQTKRVD